MNIATVIFLLFFVGMVVYLWTGRGSKTTVLPMPENIKDSLSGDSSDEGSEETVGFIPRLVGKFSTRRSI